MYKLITEENPRIKVEKQDKKWVLRGTMASFGVRNRNNRIYPEEIIKPAVDTYIKERVNTNSAFGFYGHSDSATPDMSKLAILVKELKWRNEHLLGTSVVLDTTAGKDLQAVLKETKGIGISSAGLGTTDEEGVVQEGFTILRWDVVAENSNPESWVDGILEGKQFSQCQMNEALQFHANLIVEEKGKGEFITDFGRVMKATTMDGKRKRSLDVKRYLVWALINNKSEVIDSSNNLPELDKKYGKLPVFDLKGKQIREDIIREGVGGNNPKDDPTFQSTWSGYHAMDFFDGSDSPSKEMQASRCICRNCKEKHIVTKLGTDNPCAKIYCNTCNDFSLIQVESFKDVDKEQLKTVTENFERLISDWQTKLQEEK
jgi:hypothetical protein